MAGRGDSGQIFDVLRPYAKDSWMRIAGISDVHGHELALDAVPAVNPGGLYDAVRIGRVAA